MSYIVGRKPASCAACAAPKPAIPAPRIAISFNTVSSLITVQMRAPPVDCGRQSLSERKPRLPASVIECVAAIAKDQRRIIRSRGQRTDLQKVAAARDLTQQFDDLPARR